MDSTNQKTLTKTKYKRTNTEHWHKLSVLPLNAKTFKALNHQAKSKNTQEMDVPSCSDSSMFEHDRTPVAHWNPLPYKQT